MNLCVLGKNEGFKCQNVSACLFKYLSYPSVLLHSQAITSGTTTRKKKVSSK